MPTIMMNVCKRPQTTIRFIIESSSWGTLPVNIAVKDQSTVKRVKIIGYCLQHSFVGVIYIIIAVRMDAAVGQ